MHDAAPGLTFEQRLQLTEWLRGTLLTGFPWNPAAAILVPTPLITITAWEGIVDRAKVHAGQTVLIHAGAGGVGHIAVQLAKAAGANVFATVSAEKKSVVEQFGAIPVDYYGFVEGHDITDIGIVAVQRNHRG